MSTVSAPLVVFLNDAQTYTLHIVPSAEALAELAAKAVVFTAQKALERRGVFHWALSGGSTPRALYARLAQAPLASQVPWEHVHVWWGDERNVPADHAESNYRMAHEALLAHVPIPQAHVHRVHTELGAEQAADHYEAELRAVFGLDKAPPSKRLTKPHDRVLTSFCSAWVMTVILRRCSHAQQRCMSKRAGWSPTLCPSSTPRASPSRIRSSTLPTQ